MLQCAAVCRNACDANNVPTQLSFSTPSSFVCCSVVQYCAVCCSVVQCVAVCCSVLQCVAVCCSVLQCFVMSVTPTLFVPAHLFPFSPDLPHLCTAISCSVLQYVAVCCCVLQCVAVCCSALKGMRHMYFVFCRPNCLSPSLPHFQAKMRGQEHICTNEGSTLQRNATHCNALQRTAMHCNALQCTTHNNALQRPAARYAQQRTATHCSTQSTLQHSVAHWSTL